MVILFFGDVFGRPGRETLKKIIPIWHKKYKPDFVVANVENIAHGNGVTEETLDDLEKTGLFDVYTSGDHIVDKSEAKKILQNDSYPLLRPLNYKDDYIGDGYKVVTSGAKRLLVINVLGKVFIKNGENLSNPLLVIDEVLEKYTINNSEDEKEVVDAILVDVHAEATAEKRVLGSYLDGRVSAVLGTHTHVPTRDEQILPKGTAYISDVGMVGPYNSSLGIDFKNLTQEYLTDEKQKREIGDDPRVEIGAVLVHTNKDGLAQSIEHLRSVVQK